jgi:hypothetical protein
MNRQLKTQIFRVLSGFLLFISPLLVQNVSACSCMPGTSSIYEKFNGSKAVFTGKIVSFDEVEVDNYPKRRYHFQLIENLKGTSAKNLTIYSDSQYSSCFARGAEVGESYLVFAWEGENGNLEGGSFCSTFQNLESAADAIYFIRELIKGKPESQIYGTVSFSENNLQTNEWSNKYLQNLVVEIKSSRRVFSAVTDQRGVFRFNRIPPGEYSIKVKVPSKYRFYSPLVTDITITKDGINTKGSYFENFGRAAFVEFNLGWNNEVAGNIIDSENKNFERARVRLLPISKAKDKFPDSWTDLLGRRNGYIGSGYATGKYVLAVEIDSPLSSNNNLRFYYPQAAAVENAQIFDIAETTRLNLEIKLPENIKPRILTGDVLRENGGSVGGFVSVSLDSMEDAGNPKNKQFAEMAVNAQGQFEFNTLENEEYWLHVLIDEEIEGEAKQAKKVIKTEKIKIGKEETPRKIIISLPQN